MITTLLRVSRIAMSRDRVALMMAFVLPVAFFSIFALVFGRQSMSSLPRVRVAVVDEDRSANSRALVAALAADSGLRARDSIASVPDGPRVPVHRARAEELVRAGDYPIAIILPAGWGRTFPDFSGRGMPVEILSDPSDPVARSVVSGLLQRAGARVLRGNMGAPGGTAAASNGADPLALIPSRVREVLGDRSRGGGRMVAFYAAGIAVMFMLFSTTSASGALLDEQDSGTLERVLNTRVGMNGLLAAKWLHVTLLGAAQITVMFLWGWAVFHLDLFGHLPGFAVMTALTASAAAAFGLVLATLCRTRQQLGGTATLVILIMSALGGSMFPRFLMSDTMQKVGLVTFNAWALDGYIKVFWREAPLLDLWPQALVLGGLTIAFLTTARLLARRWEAA